MIQQQSANQIIRMLAAGVRKFDGKDKNEYAQRILRCIRTAVLFRRPLRFLLFTCSTINAQYLFSKKPWLYVNTNPRGNNLESDLSRLEQIIEELRAVYSQVEIVILIGNTDPYYIYLRQFTGFTPSQKSVLWEKFAQRWRRYKKNLEKWLEKTYPLLKCNVVSWYTFERDIEKKNAAFCFEREYRATLKDISAYFTQKELDWEFNSLVQQFGRGKYFEGLNCPSAKLLREWVKRKFSEYAVQGKWIYEQFPNAILIQNEKPSDLRSRMYQSLIAEKYQDVLPITYFFGVDNLGYQ